MEIERGSGPRNSLDSKIVELILTDYESNLLGILLAPSSPTSSLNYYDFPIDILLLENKFPEAVEKLYNTPMALYQQLQNCIIQAQINYCAKLEERKLEEDFSVKYYIHVQFIKVPILPKIYRESISELDVQDINKFLIINGTIIRVNQKNCLLKSITYECKDCSFQSKSYANYENMNKITPPKICTNKVNQYPNTSPPQRRNNSGPDGNDNYKKTKKRKKASKVGEDECGCSKFRVISDAKEFQDYQEIRIQEIFGKIPPGRIPRFLQIILEGNLANKYQVGMTVQVSGMLFKRGSEFKNDLRPNLELCFFVNNVIDLEKPIEQEEEEEITWLSPEESFDLFWYGLKSLKSQIKGRNEILQNICPDLSGLYNVKLGFILCLIGGVSSKDNGTNIRGLCHMLLIGEPGTGKSFMLKYISKLAPRAILTNAAGATVAGLTASCVQEAGKWTLDAGVLVLTDLGVCCIDELNLLKLNESASILEVMEQQTLSISKAGVNSRISSRTTIIAACNPVGKKQKYDEQKDLMTNTKISSPLLSRFDLIFVMSDTVNYEEDSQKCDLIWNQFVKNPPVLRDEEQPKNQGRNDGFPCNSDSFRNYIEYVQQRFRPSLAEPTKIILHEYYTYYRSRKANSPRSTTRLLESLIRLCQAHARLMYRGQNLIDGHLQKPRDKFLFKSLKKTKVLKTLKDIKISSLRHSYMQEVLKNSKVIKAFSVRIEDIKIKMRRVPRCLKRLPSSVKSLEIFLDQKKQYPDTKNMLKIAKYIGRFPQLESFLRYYPVPTQSQRSYLLKELRIYDRSISRLKKMRKFIYYLHDNEMPAFQNAMKGGFSFRHILGLKLYFSAENLPDYSKLEDFLRQEENSDQIDITSKDFDNLQRQSNDKIDAQKNEESLDDDELDKISFTNRSHPVPQVRSFWTAYDVMKKEMKPFYHFQVFPNLKVLIIKQFDCLYPLGSFVIDEFEALRQLECLKLCIRIRSLGTKNIFKGLLKLPLLREFSLDIPFLKKKDWNLLQNFLKIQKDLEGFSLSVNEKAPNQTLENEYCEIFKKILRGLANNLKLRCLTLKSEFWSIETLAQGLDHFKTTDQFQGLEISVSGNPIISRGQSVARVKEFCNFLENQKGSLEKLFLTLPLAADVKTMNLITKTISQLNQLKQLIFSANCGFPNELMTPFSSIQENRKTEGNKEFTIKWASNLYLRKLENLEEIHLAFRIPANPKSSSNANLRETTEKDNEDWFLEIFPSLSTLNKLTKVSVMCSFEKYSNSLEERLISRVQQFAHTSIRELTLCVWTHDYYFVSGSALLDQAVRNLNMSQSKRCDLMF